MQQTGEYIEKLEREKKQLKALLKSKDPNFNFEMEIENEEPEINQVKEGVVNRGLCFDTEFRPRRPRVQVQSRWIVR